MDIVLIVTRGFHVPNLGSALRDYSSIEAERWQQRLVEYPIPLPRSDTTISREG